MPIPTFTPDIPQSGQSLGSSRVTVANNNNALAQIIAVNHVAANATNAGFHTHADFLTQAASPGTAGNVISMYTKNSGAATDLYIQRAGQAASGTDIQMTSGTITTPTNATPTNGGTCFLGAIQMRFGRFTGNNAAQPIVFSSNFNTALLGLFFSFEDGTGTPLVYTVSAKGVGGFTVTIPLSNAKIVDYLALGF